MKLTSHLFFCAAIALLLAGCIPSERFWWSPDGSRAAVVVGEELRIVDAKGETLLSPEFERVAGESAITGHVEWIPGGDSMLVLRLRGFRSWKVAKAEFPQREAEEIEKLARSIPVLAEAAIALGGDADSVESLLARLKTNEPDRLRNAFYLSYEQDAGALAEVLSKTPKLRAKLEETGSGAGGYALNQLDVVQLNPGGASIRPLLRSIVPLTPPQVSPEGRSVLLGHRRDDGALLDLVTVDIASGAENPVAAGLYPAYAWLDGQSVLALSPLAGSESLVKQVKRFTLGKNKEWTEETLATALMPFAPRLEVLPDHSVLFACQTGSLPAVQLETLPGSALFRYLLESRELVQVPAAEGTLPMNLGYFTASPDGKWVAVVESDTDAVAVVEIASGKVDLISKPHANSKCRTLPAWRNARELSFARLNEKSGRVEWLLWNLEGKIQILNESWPEETTADWIETKKP